jgi:hypothetical protein
LAEGLLPSPPDTRAEPSFEQMLAFSELHELSGGVMLFGHPPAGSFGNKLVD